MKPDLTHQFDLEKYLKHLDSKSSISPKPKIISKYSPHLIPIISDYPENSQDTKIFIREIKI